MGVVTKLDGRRNEEVFMLRALLLAALLAPSLALAGGGSSPVGDADDVAEGRATKDDYSLDTSGTTAKLKVNGDGTFSLVITPRNGKKVHPDAPLEVTLKDNPALKPAKQKLGRTDVADKGAKAPEVRTSFKALKTGATTLDASVSFFLCTDAWCQRMSDRVQIAVTVED